VVSGAGEQQEITTFHPLTYIHGLEVVVGIQEEEQV
jgi:hypothetical protein